MPSVPPYLDLLGIPFERGARGPDSFDCYGLAREMFRRAGVTVPDFTSPGTMERAAELIASQSERWRKVPYGCLLYTSPSPRDGLLSRMPSSA